METGRGTAAARFRTQDIVPPTPPDARAPPLRKSRDKLMMRGDADLPALVAVECLIAVIDQ